MAPRARVPMKPSTQETLESWILPEPCNSDFVTFCDILWHSVTLMTLGPLKLWALQRTGTALEPIRTKWPAQAVHRRWSTMEPISTESKYAGELVSMERYIMQTNKRNNKQ